ncbi:MAG: hypothetical protein ABID45_02760 [Patescibacteria group bacterium]
MKKISLISMTVAIFCLAFTGVAEARVRVDISGSSDGETLEKIKLSATKGKQIRVTDSGGTISTAKARAQFRKRSILLGNKVVSAGTDGDQDPTNVSAGSLYAGTATFYANNKKKVKNFKINAKFTGKLKCKVQDGSGVPEGHSHAAAETEIMKNGTTIYTASASQDGAGTLTQTGSWANAFTTDDNITQVNKTDAVNLGTLTHGQKMSFYFSGLTNVYYDSDVPIEYCTANFYGTDWFKQNKKSKNKGYLRLTTASKASLIFDPTTLDLTAATADPNSTDTVTVYVESKKRGQLKKLKKGTFRLHTDYSPNSFVTAESMAGKSLTDVDNDKIKERAFTVNAYDLATLISESYNNESAVTLTATVETKNKYVLQGIGSLGLTQ